MKNSPLSPPLAQLAFFAYRLNIKILSCGLVRQQVQEVTALFTSLAEDGGTTKFCHRGGELKVPWGKFGLENVREAFKHCCLLFLMVAVSSFYFYYAHKLKTNVDSHFIPHKKISLLASGLLMLMEGFYLPFGSAVFKHHGLLLPTAHAQYRFIHLQALHVMPQNVNWQLSCGVVSNGIHYFTQVWWF